MPTETTARQTIGQHAESPPEGYLTGVRFEHLVVLNKRTNDGRQLVADGFDTREMPLPFSAMFATTHGEPGQAMVVGIVDEVVVNEDGTVDGRGWLLDSLTARQAGRMIQVKAIRGNSVELSPRKVDIRWDEARGGLAIDFLDYQLAATTSVARPAMEGCFVYLEEDDFDFGDLGEFNDETEALIERGDKAGASIESFSVAVRDSGELDPVLSGDEPSRDWFSNPNLEVLTPVQVDTDGRVYGHLAGWDTPHLGVPGVTLLPPRSRCDYAYFATGSVLCDDGSFVPVGRLTYGGHHADREVDWKAATEHYDNALSAWAHVAIGEDALGIWVAGYVRPGVDDATVSVARASALSGDWRRIGGRLELVGALSVSSPAFPVARPVAFADGGVQTSLIGAGTIAPRWVDQHLGGNLLPEDTRADLKVLADKVRSDEAAALEAALAESEMADLEEALG